MFSYYQALSITERSKKRKGYLSTTQFNEQKSRFSPKASLAPKEASQYLDRSQVIGSNIQEIVKDNPPNLKSSSHNMNKLRQKLSTSVFKQPFIEEKERSNLISSKSTSNILKNNLLSHKRSLGYQSNSPENFKTYRTTLEINNSRQEQQFEDNKIQNDRNLPFKSKFANNNFMNSRLQRRKIIPNCSLEQQLFQQKLFYEQMNDPQSKNNDSESAEVKNKINKSEMNKHNFQTDLTSNHISYQSKTEIETSIDHPLFIQKQWKSSFDKNMNQTMRTANSTNASQNTNYFTYREFLMKKKINSQSTNDLRKMEKSSFDTNTFTDSCGEDKVQFNISNRQIKVEGNQGSEELDNEIYKKKFIKLNPSAIIQTEKMQKIQILKNKQMALNIRIQQRNFNECIDILRELLTLAANEKHLNNFAETIGLMGSIYEYNHDLENALYSFLQLKSLSEIVCNAKMKMKALTLLGQLMQDESDYQLAMILFRRAIHYSWYSEDIVAESNLYDKLGYLYFMQGNIEKAKYFHQRSIEHLIEDHQSETRQQSIFMIQKEFKDKEMCFPSLNQMVLAKLGLVTEQGREIKFSTKISAETQIQQLKEDKEFNYAKLDPTEISPDSQKLNQIIPEGMENKKEYQMIQKIMDLKDQFHSVVLRNTQYKDPREHNKIDQSVLKQTLEHRVKNFKLDVYDNNRLQMKLKQAQVEAMASRQNKTQICFYNHCSPNRNLLGFKYTFKPNSIQTEGYFKRMQKMIMNSP